MSRIKKIQKKYLFIESPIPFLKWAGGKRWLVARHSNLLPKKYNRYFEPFLGSGAVFFHLQPEDAYLSDSNQELINTYLAIKQDWKKVAKKLAAHKKSHSEKYYYQIRDSKPRSLASVAAKFIYLNRTCWNGLYRVNNMGKFNVPIGTQDTILLQTDNFELIAKKLQNAQIYASDFEHTINKAKAGDFIFVDPPYTIKHNLNGFIKYNEKIFTWEDQIRLRNSLLRAKARGASIVITNANHPSIWELYEDFGEINTLARHSTLASDSSHRKASSELVIMSLS